MDKILYLVWYKHARRAETLSQELGAKLVFVYEHQIVSPWLRPLRYFVQAWKTWQLFRKEQPTCIIAQSPPIFAPLIAALWCALPRKRRVSYVIDCHPGTFYHRRWRWALPLLRFLARGAVVSLLCNEGAQKVMSRWNVDYIFLPDGLPDLNEASGVIGSEGEARIAVINTFSDDEPIFEVLQAARLVPHITFYVTGDLQRGPKEILDLKPDNVIMTGFLRGSVYNGLLHNVQGIMVLSNLQTTLDCGAFEALSLAKPTIVSDVQEQRRVFGRGFLLVENTPEALARGAETLLKDYTMYSQRSEMLREEYILLRKPKLEKLLSLLSS